MVRLDLVSVGLCSIVNLGAGALAAQSSLPSVASPDVAPTVVAVIDFTNSSLVDHSAYDAAERGVAALLLGELHGRPGITLVERERLDAVVDELDLVRSGRIAVADAARAGRLLGAHFVITGVIMVDPGGTLRLDARAVEVETGAIAYTETVVGRGDELVDAVARLGARIDLNFALLERRPDQPAQGADRGADSRRRADLSYARALQKEDRLDPAGALAMYRAFLEACPEGYVPHLQARARARIAELETTLAVAAGPGPGSSGSPRPR